MIIKTQNKNLTCVDLSELLGVKVKQIAEVPGDIENPGGIAISVEAKEADITADHVAVITELYGGQTVELITEDSENEIKLS